MLAWEAGRKWGIRINTISAGPLRSRAARAIGFIDSMIAYSKANAPLAKDLEAEEIGYAAAFLATATAVTGVTLYVDNGMHAMGLAMDSLALKLPQA
jgi:enoyl-[acyl-carrier protein] reductase I